MALSYVFLSAFVRDVFCFLYYLQVLANDCVLVEDIVCPPLLFSVIACFDV